MANMMNTALENLKKDGAVRVYPGMIAEIGRAHV